jgi:hypothetical protein
MVLAVTLVEQPHKATMALHRVAAAALVPLQHPVLVVMV